MSQKELSKTQEEIATKVVDSAYCVHKALGPGLLENVYEICFCHELEKRELSYKRQIKVPVEYDGIKFNNAFRLDVLVEDLIICELKAEQNNNSVSQAQLLTYLRLTGKRLGFLINLMYRLSKTE